MSSNKQVSLTLTSRGHLRKIVREHYLRDDIKCGSMLCSTCRSDQLLSFCSRDRRMEDPKALIQPPNEIYPDWHYVVCDAETIVGQSDVFSHDAIVDMIVPISVLEEVRQKSLSVYRKFRVLLNNPRKRFFLFLNEFHRHTFVRKMLGESPDDRNFRALLAVVKFYKLHLLHNEYGVHLNLLIISDNEKHRMSAKAQGYAAFSMSEYVGGFGIAELSDRLRILSENESKIGEPSEFLYPAHLSIDKIKKLMLDGKVLQGKFFANSDNRQEGYVYLNEGDETLPEEAISRDKIFVQGHLNLNRAIHDDIVAVEILPESEWTSPQSIALDDEVLADDEAHLDEPVRSLNRVKSGKIVGIIRRTRKEFCGVLQDNASHEFVHSLFIPTEKRVPKIRIETRQADRLKSLMIVVSIDSWDRKSRYPSGHYCRSIGSRSDDNTWKSIIMMQHRIPDYPFSENVIESVKDAPNLLNEDEIASRCDLRDCRCIVSVDPQGCTDIDDALHCEQLENGNFECGVHIADVTHYVRPGSAVDAEAKYRCTSVYLTDRRIDMLPPILSSNVCSLRQDEDRLAFSVFWEIKPDAEIVNTKFLKTIIKNRAALEYEQAQLMMDDAKNESAVAKSLRNLNSIARILRQKRMDRGALVLESPEVRFVLDTETQDPLDVMKKSVQQTNQMVEEFMLLANTTVANHIYTHFSQCAVLRRHPEPNQHDFEPLIKAAQSKAINLKTGTGKQLADSLNNAILVDNPYFNVMARMLATRCMTQAVYFCSGWSGVGGCAKRSDFKHYGLASDIYTHFTSPIRRYADIMVHRLLAASLHLEKTDPSLLDPETVGKQCVVLNERHRQAQYASRDSVRLHSLFFFKKNPVTEEAYIFSVLKNALKVFVPRFGLEGLLYLNKKIAGDDGDQTKIDSDKWFEYDEETQTQIVKANPSMRFTQFDKVQVKLSVDQTSSRQYLKIELVSPKIDGFNDADE